MLTFNVTSDMNEVREIIAQHRTYTRLVNDSAPKIEDFTITESSHFIAVMARNGERDKGVFLIFPISPSTAELHFAFAPKTSGLACISRQFVQWVWENTSLNRLIGRAPSYNLLSRRLAEAAGFQKQRIERSMGKKNGVKFDHIVMELRRPAQGAVHA